MAFFTSLLNNPIFASFVNPQVFFAVLLALLVYRLVSPVIDYLNPFIILINAVYMIKTALLRKARRLVGQADVPNGTAFDRK